MLHRRDGIFLVKHFFQLIPAVRSRKSLHMVFLLACPVARCCLFLEQPAKPVRQPGGPQQKCRVFYETVRRDQPELAILDVGRSVQWIQQQAIRSFVQRDRHRIGCKVTPAQVIQDRRRLCGGLAGLVVCHAQCRPNLRPDTATKGQIQRGKNFVPAGDHGPGSLKIVNQSIRFTLDGEIQIAHRRPARQVAYRASHQEHRHALGAGCLPQGLHRAPLRRC